LHFIFRPEAFIISYRSKQNLLEKQVKFIQALANFSNQFNTFIAFHALHLVFYRYFNLQSNLGASAVLLQSPPQGTSTSSPNNLWYMVKKQDSPRQLHILREVKRKAQADQEARLQQTLARISQQEAQSSASTQRTEGSIPTGPVFYKYYAVRRGRVCNIIYTTWAECKAQVHQFPGAEYKSFPTYVEAQSYLSIGVNHRANIFGSSDQDSRPPITRTDSDSESNTTTSTGAEPEQIAVAKNNDFRDGIFFGFLLGVLYYGYFNLVN
jgi:hypothetical protein